MPTPTQSLDRIIDVNIQVSPQLPSVPTFDQGLITGVTAIIPASERLRKYESLDDILLDGFTLANPEAAAAEIYFSQNPKPNSVWIGRQDLTSIRQVQVNGSNQGSGYAVGNVLGVVHIGASGGQVVVTTVGGGGAVTAVGLVTNEAGTSGTGYATGTGLATTGGGGTGCEIDILAVGDTALQAITACRVIKSAWWGCLATAATDSDHQGIAAYIEAVQPFSCYFYTTGASDVLNNVTGNIMALLKGLSYKRSIGIYSTTQSGLAPNNIYAAAAILGYAMGANTGLAGSFFTLKFKQMVGVLPEPLTLNQVTNIEGNNGNLYLTYDDEFIILEQGKVADGQFFDEILNLDMLSAGIQVGIMDLLISVPSVPQTDPGQTQLIAAVNRACQDAVNRGFLAGGVWQGPTILKLKAGDPVPAGYLSQSRPYSEQSASDRQDRKSMPIYTAIIEAGAVHSVAIGIFVQR